MDLENWTDKKQIDVKYVTDTTDKERGNFSHFPDLPKNKRGDYFWQLLSK